MHRTRRWALVLSLLVFAVTLCADKPQSLGKIVENGHMLAPRSGHSATLLHDGRVLIAGGIVRNGEFLDSTELYDPAKQTFTPSGKMSTRRVGPAAALLHDGRILIAGGWSDGPTASAEVYDPGTGKFSALPAMTSRRARALATTLPDGRVLITGGSSGEDRVGLRTAEVFDPATNKFSLVGEMKDGRIMHTATLLQDGTVLIAGGMADRDVVASAEIFDPKTDRFVPVGLLRLARYKHTSQLLADGRVLVAGGSDSRDFRGGIFDEAEVYDPAKRSFTVVPAMAAKRYKLYQEAALLPDGRVLIAGGGAKAELFDPKQSRFEELGSGTNTPQWFMTETALKNGDVLMTGGYSEDMTSTDRAWLYRH